MSNRDRGGGLAYAAEIMPSDRFARDKATICAALERRAHVRQMMIYGEAARLVGRAAQGLGKILTAIGAEEAKQDRPDLSALVLATSTDLLSYVGAGPDARERTIAVQEAVFTAWAGRE